MKTYSEKLRDPRWQKKRLEVLQRAQFKCEACDRTDETLHVHHLLYPSRDKGPWDIDSKWLECLCATCHAAREDINSLNRAQFEMRPTREIITAEDRQLFLDCVQLDKIL